jgi:hypothetical protein
MHEDDDAERDEQERDDSEVVPQARENRHAATLPDRGGVAVSPMTLRGVASSSIATRGRPAALEGAARSRASCRQRCSAVAEQRSSCRNTVELAKSFLPNHTHARWRVSPSL